VVALDSTDFTDVAAVVITALTVAAASLLAETHAAFTYRSICSQSQRMFLTA
jgi:hypothetical protein